MRNSKISLSVMLSVLILGMFLACSATGTEVGVPVGSEEEVSTGGGGKVAGAVSSTVAFRDENKLLLRMPLIQNNLGGFSVPQFTQNGKSVPERQGYVFAGWNESVRGNGNFYTAHQPLAVGRTSLVLFAQWTISTRELTIYHELRTALNEVKNALNNANLVYDDEIVIGSGVVSTDEENAAQTALMNNLSEKLSEAEILLRGVVNLVPVLNVEKANGEIGDELIAYYEYDYDAMERVQAEIEAIRKNSLFDPGRFCAKEQTMSEPKVYSVTLTSTGYYDIELYGASGGHVWSKNDKPALGGLGGYTKGTAHFNAGTVLKFRIGGEGKGTARYEGSQFNKIIDYAGDSAAKYEGAHDGGFNGGGGGGDSTSGYAGGSGGGGATDVRIKSGESGRYINGVNNWGFDTYDDLDLRVMVAGGGGGAAQSANVSSNNWPGLAGGKALENGIRKNNVPGPRAGGVAELTPMTFSDGSITSGSVKGIGGQGKKGIPSEGTGGGGGGYFGGESVFTVNDTDSTASGGGGSNYISVVFTGTAQTAPVASPVSFGNGRAIIRWSDKN